MTNIEKEDFARKLRFDAQLQTSKNKGSALPVLWAFLVFLSFAIAAVGSLILHFSNGSGEAKILLWGFPAAMLLLLLWNTVRQKKMENMRRNKDIEDHGRQVGDSKFWGRGE
jgi:hypothetical protein